MQDQRFIIEMGMGNSQYGGDYTTAAARAIEDAIRHSSIPLFDAMGISHDQMRVQVTIGVQDPDAVDCAGAREKAAAGPSDGQGRVRRPRCGKPGHRQDACDRLGRGRGLSTYQGT